MIRGRRSTPITLASEGLRPRHAAAGAGSRCRPREEARRRDGRQRRSDVLTGSVAGRAREAVQPIDAGVVSGPAAEQVIAWLRDSTSNRA
jgi:hypothetical protein